MPPNLIKQQFQILAEGYFSEILRLTGYMIPVVYSQDLKNPDLPVCILSYDHIETVGHPHGKAGGSSKRQEKKIAGQITAFDSNSPLLPMELVDLFVSNWNNPILNPSMYEAAKTILGVPNPKHNQLPVIQGWDLITREDLITADQKFLYACKAEFTANFSIFRELLEIPCVDKNQPDFLPNINLDIKEA